MGGLTVDTPPAAWTSAAEGAAPGPRPALDPELAALLAELPAAPALGADTLALLRPYACTPLEPLLVGRAVDRRETSATARDGHQLPVTVLSPSRPPGAAVAPQAPCVLWLHGGGMVMGDRFSQIDIPLEWLEELGAVVVTVDYRLAPEAGGSTAVEDGYAGLRWVLEHAEELGVDPARVVVAGTSAGGGLAAGVTLMARDLGGPAIAAQVLICPMLDHRGVTVSSRQEDGPSTWTRQANDFAWASVLAPLVRDGAPGEQVVPSHVSPALAADLSGLPSTYVDVGSAELFRDEDVEYASRIWAAGGQAELHVWAGGFHGFDELFPRARLSRAARAARSHWLQRLLRPGA